MNLDESIHIIISVIGKFNDDRWYSMYLSEIMFLENSISFNDYKKRNTMANITSQVYKSKEEIKLDNEKILSNFFSKRGE